MFAIFHTTYAHNQNFNSFADYTTIHLFGSNVEDLTSKFQGALDDKQVKYECK